MEGDSRNPQVSLLKKYDIPIEHLTYEYVQNCCNKKELERIIRILRSGQEGSYPHLLQVVEEKLRKLAPDSRALRVETPVLLKDSLSNDEWNAVQNELLSWEEEMKVMDKSLDFEKSRFEMVGNKNLPGVRKVTQPSSVKNEPKKTKAHTNSKNERIRSADYAAWDKFDVDKELLKMDVEEERKQEENQKKKREIKKQTKEKKIEIGNVDKESYSTMEQQVLANQAKDRGNECYKSGDLENALKYYDISIKFYATANAYNNRAMTYLKLKEYEKVVKDCNKVLDMEINNVKALHRRATAYQNMPGNKDNTNYYDELAWQDLSRIVLIEPNNKVVQADLQKLKKKLNIEDVGKKYRMAIYEGGEDSGIINKQIEKSSTWNIKDDSTSIENLPLTYYGPSTSTFQCKPYSMVHHALSGSAIPGQIMCKCNSDRPRQNPLCQKCGEAMCTPKPSKKAITFKPKTEIKSNTKKDNEAKNQLLKEESNKPEKFEINDNKSSKKSPKKEVKTSKVDITIEGAGGDLAAPKNETEKKMRDEEVNEKINLNEKGDQAQPRASSAQTECEGVKGSDSNIIVEDKSKVGSNLDLDKNTLIVSKTDPSEKGEKCEETKATTSSGVLHKNKTSTLDQTKISNHENTKLNSNNNLSNENKMAETSSSQSDVNHNSKKSKNKKKKSKEHKETKLRKPPEPVKIVHAAKYLQSTSVEPKIKSESPKEPQPGISLSSSCQFKEFVPNRKCLSSVPERKPRPLVIKTPDNEHARMERIKSESFEGNKENIAENKRVEDRGKENDGAGDMKNESVKSGFEFMKTWEELKKTDESFAKRAEIIRMIKPGDLGKVIGIKLDSDMLSCLLKCLERHFVETDPNIVVEFLNQLPGVPRFGLVSMFLAENDKKIMKKLIETAESRGFKLEDDIKKALSTS